MKLTVETSELIRAFGSVVQLASDDFTRPHMNGILVRQRCASQLAPLGTLEVVATDGQYPSGDMDPIVLAREGCPLLVVVMPCRLYDMKGDDKNNAPKSRRPVESPKPEKKAKVA